MRNSLIKLAVLASLGVASQVQAAAVAVPVTATGTSAYISCYNAGRTVADPKGNFGQASIISTPGAVGSDTCWIAKPSTGLAATLPAAFGTGYTSLGARNVPIPTTTGGTGNIGTLVDVAWRNATTNQCVIATQVAMLNGVDHDAGTAGVQLFEVNDIARGGFSAPGTVNAAYTILGSVSNTSPAFRVGRTFTSVQHRAVKYGNLTDAKTTATGYLDLPTNISFTGATNGEVTPITGAVTASTTAATQDAKANANYVDFTLDAVGLDDDLVLSPNSAVVYVQAPCTANPTVQSNAIRLRQTGQENTTPKSIDLSGYAIGTP